MMDRKIALVTAAGKGSPIGFSIAQAFAAAGYDLLITGRNKGRLKEASSELVRDYGINVLPVVLDITDGRLETSVAQLVQNVSAAYGRLDVLVNASQAAKVGDMLNNTKLSDLELSLASGLVPAYLLMRECYSLLKESCGIVINLVSAGATLGQPGLSILAASKEGLRGISAVAANEWADDGIAVRCVEPQVKSSGFNKWASEYSQAAGEFTELESPESFAARCVAIAQEHEAAER